MTRPTDAAVSAGRGATNGAVPSKVAGIRPPTAENSTPNRKVGIAGKTERKISSATTPIVTLAQAISVDRRQPRASSMPAPRLPMMLAALAIAL
ncbi:hypothetical protein G6F54_014260 [Rhizopus delemar]|nr:hypothetical protein G6F54_014260 [Rhizopus delemar]